MNYSTLPHYSLHMFAAHPLPGLPAYGPPALSFPRPGAFREGFVVEFTTDGGETWAANFARFYSGGLDTVRTELGADGVVVVAGGNGYIIDIETRRLVRELGFAITHIWFECGLQAMIMTNGLWFEAFTKDKTLWESRRFSWDGIRKLTRDGLVVRGEAYEAGSPEEVWLPFRMDLTNGEVEGGSLTASEL